MDEILEKRLGSLSKKQLLGALTTIFEQCGSICPDVNRVTLAYLDSLPKPPGSNSVTNMKISEPVHLSSIVSTSVEEHVSAPGAVNAHIEDKGKKSAFDINKLVLDYNLCCTFLFHQHFF
jgi:hypothetical protein